MPCEDVDFSDVQPCEKCKKPLHRCECVKPCPLPECQAEAKAYEHLNGIEMAKCVNHQCVMPALEISIWQALPRRSATVLEVVEQIRAALRGRETGRTDGEGTCANPNCHKPAIYCHDCETLGYCACEDPSKCEITADTCIRKARAELHQSRAGDPEQMYPLISDCAKCRDCRRPVHDYYVPDELWAIVVGEEIVLCWDCFADRANRKDIWHLDAPHPPDGYRSGGKEECERCKALKAELESSERHYKYVCQARDKAIAQRGRLRKELKARAYGPSEVWVGMDNAGYVGEVVVQTAEPTQTQRDGLSWSKHEVHGEPKITRTAEDNPDGVFDDGPLEEHGESFTQWLQQNTNFSFVAINAGSKLNRAAAQWAQEVVDCPTCAELEDTIADLESELDQIGAARERITELEVVFEALGWACSCGDLPRINPLSKTIYCDTPCEDGRAYSPAEWIAKQKDAVEEEGNNQ